LNVEIIISELGFMNNPQSYIVGAIVTPVQQQWFFTAGGSYNHYASVSFRKILPDELKTGNYV
jgi:hypothetical protein